MRILCVVIAFLLVVSSADGSSDTRWGSVVEGLRLGISMTQESGKPAFVVQLQNTTSEPLNITVGRTAGPSPCFNFEFDAIKLAGERWQGYDRPCFTPIGGVMAPVTVTIGPHASRSWQFLLSEIFCATCLQSNTFDRLARQKNAFQVSFQSDSKLTDDPWLGKLTSGIMKSTPEHGRPK